MLGTAQTPPTEIRAPSCRVLHRCTVRDRPCPEELNSLNRYRVGGETKALRGEGTSPRSLAELE